MSNAPRPLNDSLVQFYTVLTQQTIPMIRDLSQSRSIESIEMMVSEIKHSDPDDEHGWLSRARTVTNLAKSLNNWSFDQLQALQQDHEAVHSGDIADPTRLLNRMSQISGVSEIIINNVLPLWIEYQGVLLDGLFAHAQLISAVSPGQSPLLKRREQALDRWEGLDDLSTTTQRWPIF